MRFSELASGDRFTSGNTLWTKLDPDTARRHGSDSLRLGSKGYGYHGDAICTFERGDAVSFVPPNAP